jgi:ribonuclease P protein component
MPRIARRITQFTRGEIKRLFQTARTVYRQAGLTIRIAPRLGEIGRILIVTPKRIGTAPERNMLRRRIKALFYQEKLYSFPYDFLVLCQEGSTKLSFSELKDIFLKLSLPA